MKVKREISLKVFDDSVIWWSSPKEYWLDQDITILTDDDRVFAGILKDIYIDSLLLEKDDKSMIVHFENIKKVADTDWLCESDIRED